MSSVVLKVAKALLLLSFAGKNKAICVKKLAVADHVCALYDTGEVECWGDAPWVIETSPPFPYGFVDIAVSTFSDTCGILASGFVVCWGGSAPQPPSATQFLALDGGGGIFCGVSDTCNIECWKSPLHFGLPAGNPGATDVAVGRNHGCYIESTSQSIACWGWDNAGQVSGVAQSFPAGGLAKRVWSNPSTSCAMDVGGFVHCWGHGFCPTCRNPPPPDSFHEIAIGESVGCGIRRASLDVICWGSGYFSEEKPPTNLPAAVHIAGTVHTFCIVSVDGDVVCWGRNLLLPTTPTFIPRGAGQCDLTPQDPPPIQTCAGKCVNTQISLDHCGECNNPCDNGKFCFEGDCVCQAPLKECNGQCMDLKSDVNNCDTCGHVCPTDLCVDGNCVCRPGDLFCNSACRDVQRDPNYCGGCATSCPHPAQCVRGQCSDGIWIQGITENCLDRCGPCDPPCDVCACLLAAGNVPGCPLSNPGGTACAPLFSNCLVRGSSNDVVDEYNCLIP